MLVFDGHLDLALNALQGNRDLLLDVYTTRVREAGIDAKGKGRGMVALPQMKKGRIACSITSLVARCTGHPIPHFDYSSPTQSYAAAHGQLAYYRALEIMGHATIITDAAGLNSTITTWKRWESADTPAAEDSPPLGLIVSMESADPILFPEQLSEWYNAGVRLIGPAHAAQGRYAGGTGSEYGLTDQGPALLKEMARLGIVLDVTHLSDTAFRQSMDIYDGPVIASHSNCRTLVPNQRELSDVQLQQILDRGGMIGMVPANWQLQTGWTIGGRNRNLHITLDRAVDHIDHICNLAGSTQHVGIGSDLDGGVGSDEFPTDLDTIADLPRLAERLSDRGYSDSDVAAIMHQNWIDFMTKVWQ